MVRIARNCIDKPLNEPFKSNRKFKKLQVCTKNRSGDIVNVHFGDNRYSDFTIHKDKDRRSNFRKRHGCDLNPSKDSARYWACEELW